MGQPRLFNTEPPRDDASYAAFVRVALERGVDHPDGLTYAVPRGVAAPAVGQRVEAPLGRGNTATAGYVIEVLPSASDLDIEVKRIKPLTRTLGGGLPPGLVELARWLARY